VCVCLDVEMKDVCEGWVMNIEGDMMYFGWDSVDVKCDRIKKWMKSKLGYKWL
jgi:hypothetical protein